MRRTPKTLPGKAPKKVFGSLPRTLPEKALGKGPGSSPEKTLEQAPGKTPGSTPGKPPRKTSGKTSGKTPGELLEKTAEMPGKTPREFPELRTERLHLRQIVDRDRSALFAIFSDAETMRHYDLDPFEKKKQAEELIAFFLDREKRGIGLRWAIALPASRSKSKLIGTCGFNRFERAEARRGVVGYDLVRSHWGSGYVPEAMAAVVRYGFEVLDLNRIEAYVEPSNRGSVRVLEKLGFTCEGLLRQFAYYRRQPRDQFCFSLLASEWRETHAR